MSDIYRDIPFKRLDTRTYEYRAPDNLVLPRSIQEHLNGCGLCLTDHSVGGVCADEPESDRQSDRGVRRLLLSITVGSALVVALCWMIV